MLFCSQAYLLFFAVVFAAYWALRSHRLRVWLLLAASFYFYASWNRWLALLIGVSSALDYAIGLALDRTAVPWKRRLFLIASLAANLGLLFYFRYANFFLESAESALAGLGVHARMPVLKVIIPIGISFYTFEAINYTVDVYRRRVAAERNLGHFLLFITFFPHLVAGPIVRARDFLPQVRRPKRWDWPRMELGAQLFLLGLFKKLAIADRMAAFADPVFAQPGHFSTAAAWVAVLAYAAQLYADFSGYSDMAIGSAHLLGYRLGTNFRLPYLARNVSEFWRRWHISLSTWLRDYVFIPLGGSRGGEWATCRNLLLTMTLGGLWHGASWTFVIWGAMHGVLLVGHRAFRNACASRPRLSAALDSAAGTAACIVVTFLCVALGWVFFRATSVGIALELLARLLVPHAGSAPPVPLVSFWATMAVMAGAHFVAAQGGWRAIAGRLPAPVVGLSYASMLMLTLVLARSEGQPFVYFQF